jgi:hypothetical protein
MTAVRLRRKDPGDDAYIISVLGLSFEITVTGTYVDLAVDSALPGDHAERVAAVLDEISPRWMDHFDWPTSVAAGSGQAEPALHLVAERPMNGNGPQAVRPPFEPSSNGSSNDRDRAATETEHLLETLEAMLAGAAGDRARAKADRARAADDHATAERDHQALLAELARQAARRDAD